MEFLVCVKSLPILRKAFLFAQLFDFQSNISKTIKKLKKVSKIEISKLNLWNKKQTHEKITFCLSCSCMDFTSNSLHRNQTGLNHSFN